MRRAPGKAGRPAVKNTEILAGVTGILESCPGMSPVTLKCRALVLERFLRLNVQATAEVLGHFLLSCGVADRSNFRRAWEIYRAYMAAHGTHLADFGPSAPELALPEHVVAMVHQLHVRPYVLTGLRWRDLVLAGQTVAETHKVVRWAWWAPECHYAFRLPTGAYLRPLHLAQEAPLAALAAHSLGWPVELGADRQQDPRTPLGLPAAVEAARLTLAARPVVPVAQGSVVPAPARWFRAGVPDTDPDDSSVF